MRAAHHAGLPRHLRDRPRQPAGILQSVLPEARAADRPRSALRDQRADGRAGHGADPARRGPGARRVVGDAVSPGVEAIAILFLHSYRNPAARAARQGDRRRRCAPACSSRRRTSCRRNIASTSAPRRSPPTPMSARACATISPRWTRISATPDFGGTFLIVQSTGGLFDVGDARDSCIRMLESGPAAGVIGTKALCDAIGLPNAIAFDMGGTTAKAGVIHDGNVLMTGGALIGGYATGLPVQMPMIDIQEVGTGGGSIARVESRRRLARRAGKRRRGARSGLLRPRRQRADHHRRQSRARPARRRPLSRRRDEARRRRRRNGARPRRSPSRSASTLTEAAEGILRIATTKMAHVVRWVTTERGLDAADFALVAYGGAGPAARRRRWRANLRIGNVIIPRAPGHFSAYGMLVADLRRDFVNTWFTPLADASFADMEKIFTKRWSGAAAPASAMRPCRSAGIVVARAAPTCAMSARSTPSRVELPIELFAREDRDGIKTLLRCRARDALRLSRSPARGRDRQPARRRDRPDAEAAFAAHRGRRGAEPPAAAFRGKRPVYFAEAGFVETPTYDRAALRRRQQASPARR